MLYTLKKLLSVIFISFLFLLLFKYNTYAIIDPTSINNNVFGIHILFPEEITEAAKLVNTNGGDWGYVTIPIQAKDRDLEKWQLFMDKAKENHIIPIIRLSTEEDAFAKGTWRIPNDFDILDFANFLNSLTWPTRNRYVILFNEINRYDEWGGQYPDPIYYSDIVSYAYDVFKNKNEDFFLILGGFDNASVTNLQYMNEFDYLRQMHNYNPEIFNKIDGFASHSYPNPGFSQPPNIYRRMGIATYRYEGSYINNYVKNKKYAFITEVGWNNNSVSEETIAQYFAYTFENIWGNDKNLLVAVTPFLLKGEGQFDTFTFYKNGQTTLYYKTIENLKKIRGQPEIMKNNQIIITPRPNISTKYFPINKTKKTIVKIPPALKIYFQIILGIFN